MRLLFVSHSFPPPEHPLSNVGGMQRVATELHAALGRLPGVYLESELLHTSWRWTHVRAPFFLLRVGRRLHQEAARGSMNAVLFSSMVTASTAVAAGARLRRSGIRTAAIAHGLDVTTPFGPYQRFVPRVFDALDAVLPVSRATGEACLERGLNPSKLHVVPNGIDVTRFGVPEDRTAARQELLERFATRIPSDALLLCSVGRHVRRKGFVWFAEEVMPRLPERVHWWVGGEGPETEALKEAIARHGLGNRVCLLGRISDADLRRLYRGADLFLMPNRPVAGDMEGFGVVMLEAGLAGLPTIGAGIEGILDVVTEGVNGHLVPSGDAEGFVSRIRAFLDDRGSLGQLSSSTAQHVRETFGWEAVARKYVAVLASL